MRYNNVVIIKMNKEPMFFWTFFVDKIYKGLLPKRAEEGGKHYGEI